MENAVTAELYIQNIYDRSAEAEQICRSFFPLRTEKALRFRREEDRLRSFAAALLIREVLGLEEKDLTAGEYGKPAAPACPKHFNLSHSGSWTVLAVSSVPVGVDIEEISRRHTDLAGHILTDEETGWLHGGQAADGQINGTEGYDAEERFFALWTMKESLGKALGKGILLPLRSLNVLPLLEGKNIIVEGRPFYGSVRRYEDCMLAVCTQGTAGSAYIVYA